MYNWSVGDVIIWDNKGRGRDAAYQLTDVSDPEASVAVVLKSPSKEPGDVVTLVPLHWPYWKSPFESWAIAIMEGWIECDLNLK